MKLEFRTDEKSADKLYFRIRCLFQEIGIFGRKLSVEYKGFRYRISCDDKAFLVYRVAGHEGVRHHVTGWPVCLVNSDTIFEECGDPNLSGDHCSCGASLETWLNLIIRLYGNH
jgi:hypothetical protein